MLSRVRTISPEEGGIFFDFARVVFVRELAFLRVVLAGFFRLPCFEPRRAVFFPVAVFFAFADFFAVLRAVFFRAAFLPAFFFVVLRAAFLREAFFFEAFFREAFFFTAVFFLADFAAFFFVFAGRRAAFLAVFFDFLFAFFRAAISWIPLGRWKMRRGRA